MGVAVRAYLIINACNDGHMAGQQLLDEGQRPLLQRFRQHGVVCVRSNPASKTTWSGIACCIQTQHI